MKNEPKIQMTAAKAFTAVLICGCEAKCLRVNLAIGVKPGLLVANNGLLSGTVQLTAVEAQTLAAQLLAAAKELGS